MRIQTTVLMMAVFVCGATSHALGQPHPRRATFRPITDQPYEIQKYVYTNYAQGVSHVVLDSIEGSDDPIRVSYATGTKVRTTTLAFNPSDIHVVYKFDSSITVVYHTVFKSSPGGSFSYRFRRYPPDHIFPFEYVCENVDPGRAGWTTCCGQPWGEFGCEEGDACSEPHECGSAEDPAATDEETSPVIPTISEWGLIVLTLLGMTAGAIVLVGKRRRVVNS